MKTAILEVFAVDMAKAVGFRRIEPTGPAGDRFGLYLPSKKEGLTSFSQLMNIINEKIMDASMFPYVFSHINIDNGDYSTDAKNVFSLYFADLPREASCRINLPLSFMLGEPPL